MLALSSTFAICPILNIHLLPLPTLTPPLNLPYLLIIGDLVIPPRNMPVRPHEQRNQPQVIVLRENRLVDNGQNLAKLELYVKKFTLKQRNEGYEHRTMRAAAKWLDPVRL